MSTTANSALAGVMNEENNGEQLEYVTMTIGGQWFGIPVLSVRQTGPGPPAWGVMLRET